MVKVGIDISVNSTAICVLDKNGDYNFYNYTTKKPNYKWIKKTEEIINFRFYRYGESMELFSDNLVQKIVDYDKYTDLIINDLKKFGNEFVIGIEGYNYGLKSTDSIIDISELSSILKFKLLKNFPNSNFNLIPPKTVKTGTCKMVYNLYRKKVSINNDGVSGGNFDKNDMFNAFLDSDIDNELKDFLINERESLSKMKNIPKPFDDIIDSIFIMEIVNEKFNI